jgi:alkylation response protein AidB-like acyl-CoA dehydrogenase
MNFDPDPAETAFRGEARAFIAETLDKLFPERPRGKGPLWGASRAHRRTWMEALERKGWAVPHWPVEWGGTGWPASWCAILGDELARADAPPRDLISIGFVGPVLYTFGTDEQKRRFLPRIRCGEHAWCQGFSEADAGSDLTSLRTTAVRLGDRFLVNGRKLWISEAHLADMMFALVRVDAPGNRRQQGLSFLLIDMRAPGLSVIPVPMIDRAPHVNEVILENVQVPLENLVGEQGKGWVYARFLLDKERSLVAQVPALRRIVIALRAALVREQHCGRPLTDDHVLCARVAQYEVELAALEFLELRFLHAPEDDANAQVLASMLKLRGTELRQRVSETLWDAFGEDGLAFSIDCDDAANAAAPPRRHWSAENYLFQRSATLAGGTSEVQRNIIAAVSLGL